MKTFNRVEHKNIAHFSRETFNEDEILLHSGTTNTVFARLWRVNSHDAHGRQRYYRVEPSGR